MSQAQLALPGVAGAAAESAEDWTWTEETGEEAEVADFVHATVLKAEMTRPLLETVEALRRRSLTEPRDDGRLTLQPVVMEYITRKFVECIVEEVASERVALFDSHALMQAEAEDYVRLSQEQAVVKEIAERLIVTFGKNELVEKLRPTLSWEIH